jgi:chromosome segregation ATPase
MAPSSGSKKSTQSDSDSESDDVVRDELPFLRQENARLGSLLDNRDDMLREAKKMRKELGASLEDARTRVAELETQVLDNKLEIEDARALLFRVRLIVLIAPSFLLILLYLRRSMTPSVRN